MRLALGDVRLPLLVALVLAVSIAVSGSPAVALDGFSDLDEAGPHRAAVETLADMGVLEGTDCGAGEFCPRGALPRWVMAVWLVRVLDGVDPVGSGSRFADVDPDQWWTPFVERFAVLGVTEGCAADPARYCPHDAVTRAQMATFLAQAFDLAPAPSFGFVDTSESTHTAGIDALAAAGVTEGCAADPARYCPHDAVTRAQMATFLVEAINRTRLVVELESPSGRAVTGSFQLRVAFGREVTGFDLDDVVVVNGRARGLSGSGSAYEMTVVPAEAGSVVVRIPRAAARDAAGTGNQDSGVLVRTFVTATYREDPGFDVWDRAAVVASHRDEFGRVEPEWGYTGDVSQCVAGTTSQQFRDSVAQRANWYRQMAGLDAVSESRALSATAQDKALIVLAEGRISHSPTPDWACYRSIDQQGGENLGLGTAGVGGVDQYIRDTGDHNLAVGHRLQILSPFVTQIGSGNVRTASGRYRLANAMHLLYDWDAEPTVREERGFVAWPPAGYVPAGVVWGRWSFTKQRVATEVTRSGNVIYTRLFLTQPDFSDAAVSVTDDDGPVETTIIHRDTALVWAMEGDTRSDLLGVPTGGDHCYKITINGVKENGIVQAPYEYAVCVLDPD